MSNLPPTSESSAADETQVPEVEAKPPKASRRRGSDKGGPELKPGRRSAGFMAALMNLLAILFVVLSVVGVALVVFLFQFPGQLASVPGGSAFIAATDPPIAVALKRPTPSSVSTGLGFPTLPPAWTPTNTPTITPTPGPETPTPVPSDTSVVPTYTPSSTTTPTTTATRATTPTHSGPTPRPTFTQSRFAYNLQPGSPTYLSNFLNTDGCHWFGIVGRAFGVDSNPVINLTVHLEGGGLSVDVVTGSGPSALGPGGYQIYIADHPIDTTDVYKVQLRNNSGQKISDVYSIRTYGDCPRNMVMVNFLQNH